MMVVLLFLYYVSVVFIPLIALGIILFAILDTKLEERTAELYFEQRGTNPVPLDTPTERPHCFNPVNFKD